MERLPMTADPREQLVAHLLMEVADADDLPHEVKQDLVYAVMTYHKAITADRFMTIAKARVNIAPDVRAAYRALEGLEHRIKEHECKAFDRLDNLWELLPNEVDRPVVERPLAVPTSGSHPPRPFGPKG